jgi:hypothetical protein
MAAVSGVMGPAWRYLLAVRRATTVRASLDSEHILDTHLTSVNLLLLSVSLISVPSSPLRMTACMFSFAASHAACGTHALTDRDSSVLCTLSASRPLLGPSFNPLFISPPFGLPLLYTLHCSRKLNTTG